MEDLGYYNGAYDRIANMKIPMDDRVHWFGDGVYEVTYARNHQPFALDEHLDRLYNSARLLDIVVPLDRDELAQLLVDLIAKVDASDQFVYWQVTRGNDPLRSHTYEAGMKGNLWAFMHEQRIDDMSRPLAVITREDTRYLHCNIKTLNLLPAVRYSQVAKEAGCDECILVRDGRVTESAHSNVHILKDETLITHPADNLILPGIARAHLMRMCESLGLGVEERAFTPEEMQEADEVIITSSGSFCMRVTSIDGKPVGGKDSVTIAQLQNALKAEFEEATA